LANGDLNAKRRDEKEEYNVEWALTPPELAASFYQACDLAFWHFSDLEFAPTEVRSLQ
jgi:hypothetical protein